MDAKVKYGFVDGNVPRVRIVMTVDKTPHIEGPAPGFLALVGH